MRDVRVEKCCCFNLETGVTIIGVVDLVFGILSLIYGGVSVGKHTAAGSVGLIAGSKFKIIFTLIFIILCTQRILNEGNCQS